MNNKKLNLYDVFNSIINDVISKISNVKHDKLIITLDHMLTKNNLVTLMFNLKIVNQGIPLWFSTEKTKFNCLHYIGKTLEKNLI